jgi:hypothetical protein
MEYWMAIFDRYRFARADIREEQPSTVEDGGSSMAILDLLSSSVTGQPQTSNHEKRY